MDEINKDDIASMTFKEAMADIDNHMCAVIANIPDKDSRTLLLGTYATLIVMLNKGMEKGTVEFAPANPTENELFGRIMSILGVVIEKRAEWVSQAKGLVAEPKEKEEWADILEI